MRIDADGASVSISEVDPTDSEVWARLKQNDWVVYDTVAPPIALRYCHWLLLSSPTKTGMDKEAFNYIKHYAPDELLYRLYELVL